MDDGPGLYRLYKAGTEEFKDFTKDERAGKIADGWCEVPNWSAPGAETEEPTAEDVPTTEPAEGSTEAGPALAEPTADKPTDAAPTMDPATVPGPDGEVATDGDSGEGTASEALGTVHGQVSAENDPPDAPESAPQEPEQPPEG